MRLAVSNIAWLPEEDDRVHRLLADQGVDAIEIAPTRLWADPSNVADEEAHAVASRLRAQGLEPYSFQSLLFARPDLTLFDNAILRAEMADYLVRVIRLASLMGVQRLVFGSPRSRLVPDNMSTERAFGIAVDFFRLIGDEAAAFGTMICIEPNPAAYSCNFVTNADQGAELVRAVNSDGFKLHLDVAGLLLAGQDPAHAVDAFGPLVEHAHASAPHLGPLESDVVDHYRFARALNSASYRGIVSIEMKAGAMGENAARVKSALDIARGAYGW